MTDAISSILSQIRAHETRMRGMSDVASGNGIAPTAGTAAGGVEGASGGGFKSAMSNAIDNVSKVQNDASQLQQAFEMGDPKADLARVMVAMQQSQVAFRATVEVRNRLVQAYQDVMNMPI
ncbi:flagellar hook-basal body complex protein FliE [Lysobacter sp. TY2-98]|uniref:flagellar hook-basal body complex protein FliE n=1 Tax=Lysobacter sp. TY2-98 TaxID=2290922 RepID=UPI000E201205|nr:flagellar hook-basal body complex protein FliE [Lysobacter sp. TY2-98]AXK71218.1 flagellar hook-basal body complex protein FliE [Lysobacter sp. TY2-98]